MKKTEFITCRTDIEIKRVLEEIAKDKKWTLSFVVGEIVEEWLKEHRFLPEDQ